MTVAHVHLTVGLQRISRGHAACPWGQERLSNTHVIPDLFSVKPFEEIDMSDTQYYQTTSRVAYSNDSHLLPKQMYTRI